MTDIEILVEILKQQRNQALDALANAFVKVNLLEKELSELKDSNSK